MQAIIMTRQFFSSIECLRIIDRMAMFEIENKILEKLYRHNFKHVRRRSMVFL
jgi:hypothetical protein